MTPAEQVKVETEGRSFTEVVNHPIVIAAYDVLRNAGLLQIPQRAEIFCAYCGAHIIYTERTHQTRAEQATAAAHTYDPTVAAAVAEHRAGCDKFKATSGA